LPEYHFTVGDKMYTAVMPGVIPVKADRVYSAMITQIRKGKKRGEITMRSTDGESFKASWAPYQDPKAKAAARVAAKAKPPARAKPKLQRQKRRHT